MIWIRGTNRLEVNLVLHWGKRQEAVKKTTCRVLHGNEWRFKTRGLQDLMCELVLPLDEVVDLYLLRQGKRFKFDSDTLDR